MHRHHQLNLRLRSATIIFLVLGYCFSARAVENIEVDPHCTRSIGGISELDRNTYFAICDPGTDFDKRCKDDEMYSYLIDTVDHFIVGKPLPGMPEISIPDYLKLDEKADRSNLRTPPQVAQNLDRFAADTLRGCKAISAGDLSPALAELVTDLQAMAWLGHYYANKINGATALAKYRQSKQLEQQQAAVQALEVALASWRRYASLAGSLYRPQVMARGQDLDWQALTADVEKDIELARKAIGSICEQAEMQVSLTGVTLAKWRQRL